MNLLKVLFDLSLLGVFRDAVNEQSALHLQDTKLGLEHKHSGPGLKLRLVSVTTQSFVSDIRGGGSG